VAILSKEVCERIATLPSPKILLIGEDKLRNVSVEVTDVDSKEFTESKLLLHKALADFRKEHGFGRSIAAPQIGVNQRFLAVNLGDGPFTVINPVIIWRSPKQITLWDDCFSFPWIMVRVQRHESISVQFKTDDGSEVIWKEMDRARSELFQHEIDHLDGV